MMLTLEETKAKLEALVEKLGPDTVYEIPDGSTTCVYSTAEGAPSCLVGQLIHEVSPEILEEIHSEEWEDGVNILEMDVDTLALRYPRVDALFDADAKVYLNTVQYLQDKGVTWGEAIVA